MFKKLFPGEKNKTIISELLDDLTHLEINTIIKESMTAAAPPENAGAMLKELIERYRDRVDKILYENGLSDLFNKDNCKSFEELQAALEHIFGYLKSENIRIEDNEYNRMLRMESFCKFIKYRDDEIIVDDKRKGKEKEKSKNILYRFEFDGDDCSVVTFEFYTRDLVKVKRFYDLGNEEIIMQTRVGIDGDVVTRIGRDFANNPKQLIIDIHDKHTNLSVNYWKSLIEIVKDLVSGIVRKY